MPQSTKQFYYYRHEGTDWTDKQLMLVVAAETITKADELFEQQTGLNPSKDSKITVTLAPLNISR